MGAARKDSVDQQINAELAQARSEVYGLLARVFRAEPDAQLIQHLKKGETACTLEGLGFPVSDCFPNIPEEQLLEDLAVEYARLFVGPGPRISLYESVNANIAGHSEAALWSERTVKVKNFIEATGLSYEKEFAGLPDHVSVELEFLQRLAMQEAEAHREGCGAEAETLFNIQRKFFEEHLGAWLPVLCGKVATNAREPFYSAIADLAKAVVEFERELFGIDLVQS
jgi:putative dimethyl sulfoxide reductase chaperone